MREEKSRSSQRKQFEFRGPPFMKASPTWDDIAQTTVKEASKYQGQNEVSYIRECSTRGGE